MLCTTIVWGPANCMKYTATTTWLPILASLILTNAATAAPTTDAPARDADVSRGSGLPDISGVADSQGQSKTVRMLLELQNSPPPLEGTGDAKRAEAQARKAAERAAADRDLTSGDADAQNKLVDWRSGLPGRTVNSQRSDVATNVVGREGTPSGRESRQLADDRIDVKAMLPARIVAFLRENREWVLLGGIGLLGLVWLAASGLSQRRR